VIRARDRGDERVQRTIALVEPIDDAFVTKLAAHSGKLMNDE
jgi:hypothetical protein